MQPRDAVHRVASDGREMRHAHRTPGRFVDERHPRHPALVAGKAATHLVEEAPVDLEDDFEMAGKEAGEKLERPSFESLWEESVVRVCQRLLRDLPRGVPTDAMLVDEEPHQLGDRERGVRVVELYRVLRLEGQDALRGLQVDPDHVPGANS